jgi:hypothetical protein
MTTIDAPDAPFRLTAPIERITKLDDGTLLVHCLVTDETPDSQGEIVDYDAAKAAAPAMMKWATLGEMHDEERMDAGTVLRLHFDDVARRIEADLHVVDPVAVRKVLSRTYKAVSVGGVKLATSPVSIAGRVFRKITRLVWDELSLVNRGANPNALIAKQYVLAKRAQETDMPDMDAGTTSPLGEPTPATDESRSDRQVAIDAARELLAKAEAAPEAPFPGAKAPFGAKKVKKAKAEKHATVVIEAPEGEPDGDEADETAPKEAKKKLTKAQRLAKKVKALRKANRRLAKAKKKMAKRATPRSMLSALAKAGARNSKSDAKLIDQGHDVFLKLGYAKCMTKAEAPVSDAATIAAEAPMAKADTDPVGIMREALTGTVPVEKLDAIIGRLAAIDERSKAQDETLAKIAKSPSGGGPATPFAAIMRGQSSEDAMSKGDVLAKAAELIDDPRLREQVGDRAAFEQIRQARSG